MDSLNSPYISAQWDPSTLNAVERGQLSAIVSGADELGQRQDLLNWSQTQITESQAPLALEILYNLAQGNDAIAKQAEKIHSSCVGTGFWQDRLEFHSQSFLHHLTDPALLGGMVGGAIAFQRLHRLGMGWWRTARGSSWTQHQAGKLAASALGFSGEVPVFLGTEKAIRHFSGQAQDWSAMTLWKEGQTLAWQLFFLKSFQSLSNTVFYRAHGMSSELGALTPLQGASGVSQKLLPYASSVGGIFVANHAEAWRQEMPAPDAGMALLDAMVFSAQYGFAGRLGQEIISAPMARKNSPQKTSTAKDGQLDIFSPLLSQKVYLTPEGIPLRWDQKDSELFAPHAWSRTLKPGEGTSPAPSETFIHNSQYRDALSKVLKIDPNDPQMFRIHRHISNTQIMNPQEFQRQLLFASFPPAPSLTRFHTHENLSSADILERGTHTVRRAFKFDAYHKVYGTAFDALTQIIISELLPRNQPQVLGDFFRLLAFNPHMNHLEGFMEQHGIGQSFQMPPLQKRPYLPANHPWAKKLNDMLFIGEEHRILTQYLATYLEGTQVPIWMRPENNYVEMSDGSKISITPELAFAVIKKTHDYLKTYRNGLEILHLFEMALNRAEDSAIPWFYFDRLIKVMLTDNPRQWNTMQPRFLEIAYTEGALYSQFFHTMEHSQKFAGNLEEAIYYTDGSVFSAYLNDPKTARRLVDILPKISRLLDAQTAQKRRDRFFEKAQWALNQTNFEMGRETVLSLLEFTDSPTAKAAVADIRSGKLDFELATQEVMNQYLSGDHGQTGLFIPPRLRKDGVRNRPLILIIKDHPEVNSKWDLLKRSVDYPRWLIHEYSHFKNDYSESEGFILLRDAHHQMRGEFRAFLEETFLAMNHGFIREWLQGDINPYGWAGSMRGVIEQAYWEAPRELWVDPQDVESILE